jgi:hypothetical protein
MAVKLFANVAGRKRLHIPEIQDGFWIECREELAVGEKRGIFSRAFKGQVPLADGGFRNEYDMQEIGFGQVCAYLVDWSDKTEISADAVRAMTPEAFALIEAAVSKHIEEMEKNAPAAEARKKRNGVPISPSAVA